MKMKIKKKEKEKVSAPKKENTHRFKTLSERLKLINIDVIHKVGRIPSNPEDASTFFLEAIQKWMDLNYTENYEELQQEIGSEIKTLSQLVFRKDEIVDILVKHLSKENSMALDALLELVVALARDLQFEFYPHFPKFFDAICIHLSTQDTDLLEKLFTCLAYLFKFLWKYMVKDIKAAYSIFYSLLSSKISNHVRSFAVESFAFLLRKVANKEELFKFIFCKQRGRSKETLGLGLLFFEIVKGVKGQFHSCTGIVLKTLLSILGTKLQTENGTIPIRTIEYAIRKMLITMTSHTTTREHCIIVQDTLCDAIAELHDRVTSDGSENDIAHLLRLLRLFYGWINFKKGKLVTSTEKIMETLTKLCKWDCIPDVCMKIITEIIPFVLISKCIGMSIENIHSIMQKIYQSASNDEILCFTQKFFRYGMFEKDVLPYLLAHCVDQLKKEDSSAQSYTLHILSATVSATRKVVGCGKGVKSFRKLQLYSPVKENESRNEEEETLLTSNVIERFIIETVANHKDVSSLKINFAEIWSSLICLPHLRFFNVDYVSGIVEALIHSVHSYLLSNLSLPSETSEPYCYILYQAYISWLCITKDYTRENPCDINFFISLLRQYPASVSVLRMSDLFFNFVKISLTFEEIGKEFFICMIHNLASPFNLVRLYSLQILCAFKYNMPTYGSEQVKSSDNVFSICLEAEKIPVRFHTYRENLKLINRLEYPFVNYVIPTDCDEFIKAPLYYMFGMLYVNFSHLWSPCINVIESHAHGSRKTFWNIFWPYFEEVTALCEENSLKTSPPCDESDKRSELETFFDFNMKGFSESVENPDVINHRLMLFSAMKKFPDVVEAQNKSFIPFIFRFLRNEMHRRKFSAEPTSKTSTNNLIKGTDLSIQMDDTKCKGFKRKSDVLQEAENRKKQKKSSSEIENDIKDESILCETDSEASIDDTEAAIDDTEAAIDDTEAAIDDTEAAVDDTEAAIDDTVSLNVPDNSVVLSEVEGANKTSNSHVRTCNNSSSNKCDKKGKVLLGKRPQRVSRTLSSFLIVLTKFKNPRSLYRGEDLLAYYYELLCSTESTFQKLAFDCIMTFKFEYLMPYKDVLYKLFKSKLLRSVLMKFSVNSECAVILEEHRMNVAKILMRILFGKMHVKTKKDDRHFRQTIIFRFLACCKVEEIQIFLELVFASFKGQLKDDTLHMVLKIRQNLNLSATPRISKLRSTINSMSIILDHLGNLIPDLLPWLFKILLLVTTTSTALLERRQEVLPQCITLLKSVRIFSMMRLIQFFEAFTQYNFTPEELDAVFEAIVWPMVFRLKFESRNMTSPLLQLLQTWSENPRYIILLAKRRDSSSSLSCLSHLISLYAHPQTKDSVIDVVSTMIFNILTLKQSATGDEQPPLKVNFGPSETTEDLGISMLQPYVGDILRRMKKIISAASKKIFSDLVTPRELTILLKISNFVEDARQCYDLIILLLPFITRKNRSPGSEVLILSTILNLIGEVNDLESVARTLSPLFEKVIDQNARAVLVKIFAIIEDRKGSCSEIASIMSMVNAWDKKFVSLPDFNQRLNGHKQALQLIKSMDESSMDVYFCKLIIFNSCFVVTTIEDMALQDDAAHLLMEIIDFFSAFEKSSPVLFNDIIFLTILPLIQKKLHLENESVRHEFISILAHVLQKNKDHPKLQELTALCHEDPDLDFWECIRHLQLHRRAKALRQLATSIKTRIEKNDNFNVKIIMAYLNPIITSFLSDSFHENNDVIDAAIEAMGAIACVMSWNHYESLLTKYLNLLFTDKKHPKTTIKIAVAVINAFHFDVFMDGEYKKNTFPQHELPGKVPTGKKLRKSAAEKKGNIAMAIKINDALTQNVIPMLHRSLMKKNRSDDEHKLAGITESCNETIELRVPIALALVKLLQKLPVKVLESNLPKLFFKMCETLKFKHESVRNVGRVTLTKIMLSVGPKYFNLLLSELTGVLTRGFQFHVMMSSINTVLVSLADQFKPGNLNSSVHCLTKICMNELFTDVAEEKEVVKIVKKWKEAETIKSYSILQVLSQFVSESCLLDLIVPLKEVMAQKHTHKDILKVQACLRSIALGLSENKGLSTEAMLIFVHAICTENVPQLIQKRTIDPVDKRDNLRPDIYLIPAAPGRSGPPAKINVQTNAYIFVEFGFQLLLFALKKQKIDKSFLKMQEMLDPFVAVTAECLHSNHVKIISNSLRCLMLMYSAPLPSLKDHSSEITTSLFVLLSRYACIGMSQGGNFEMVVMCFKMLTMIVKDANYHHLTTDQLNVLLSYVEQDLSDHTKQSNAFSLLEAILSKKLQSPELRDVMTRLAELQITSEEVFVRTKSTKLCLQYMLTYPLGKKLKTSISFFLSQLEYHLAHGRIAALETIHSLLSKLPEAYIREHSGLFFIPLAARLVNDESMQCRKMTSHCIKKLLKRLENDARNNLFDIALTWLKSKKLSHQRLGAQVCGIFAEVETDNFEHRVQDVLPIIIEHLEESKFLKPISSEDERCTDHFLYHLLNSFTKVLSCCPIIRKKKFSDKMNRIWELAQGFILHPHSWVRLAVSQLFGLLFSVYKAEEVSNAMINGKEGETLICFIASRKKLRDMSADFCTQLQSSYLNETHGKQIIRNLVYVAKVISELPTVLCDPEKNDIEMNEPEKNDLEAPDDGNVKVTLSWMIRKLNKEATKEVAFSRHSSDKRKFVFMFIGAIAHELTKEKVMPVLENILWSLCREISDASKYDGNLKQTVEEIFGIIRKKVGNNDFNNAYAAIKSAIAKKKIARKHEKAIEAISDPQKHAKRRLKNQQSKKESKRRKILVMSGKRKTKRAKQIDFAIET